MRRSLTRLLLGATAGLAAACRPAPAAPPGPAPGPAAAAPGDPRSARVYVLSEVDETPDLVNRDRIPEYIRRYYPRLLHDAGVEGTVSVRFVVGVDGRPEPSTIQVVSSSHDHFNSPGERVAAAMRFSPAKVAGTPVRVAVTMPISFTLH
jgi:periplasmic protein TonB